jgi:hypothetical protein
MTNEERARQLVVKLIQCKAKDLAQVLFHIETAFDALRDELEEQYRSTNKS